MIKKIFCLIISTLLIFLFFSCETNINSMIEDYNSNFIPDPEMIKTSGPSPGDKDFTEGSLLEDEYFVWEDATLNISAPQNCAEYSWIISDPNDEDDTPIHIHHLGHNYNETYNVWNRKDFCINILDSGLEVNKVYKLTLRITSKEGIKYTDSAAVVVYQHLYL